MYKFGCILIYFCTVLFISYAIDSDETVISDFITLNCRSKPTYCIQDIKRQCSNSVECEATAALLSFLNGTKCEPLVQCIVERMVVDAEEHGHSGEKRDDTYKRELAEPSGDEQDVHEEADEHEDEHDSHTEEDSHIEVGHDSHAGDSHEGSSQLCVDLDAVAARLQCMYYDCTRFNGKLSLALLRIFHNTVVQRDCGNDVFSESLQDEFAFTNTMPLADENLDIILEKLKIGKHHDEDEAEEVDDHDGHGHGRKKRAINVNSCVSEAELLRSHSINPGNIFYRDFVRLCPALLQQHFAGGCTASIPMEKAIKVPRHSLSERWGYGFLAVFIVSLASGLGILSIPLIQQCYEYVMNIFMSLGAATLAGDAMLHLLPLATGVHAPHGDAPPTMAEFAVPAYVWRYSACLLAIYVFFLLETLMYRFNQRSQAFHTLDHGHAHLPDITRASKHLSNRFDEEDLAGNSNKGYDDAECDSPIGLDSGTASVASANHCDPVCPGDNGRTVCKSPCTDPDEIETVKSPVLSEKSSEKKKFHEHGHSHAAKGSALVITILIGDCIHNFMDGIAMGTSFSNDVVGGVGTSIAILCHEIPHELGDFAILLNSGMSIKRALLLNVLSQLTAFVGFFIGMTISVDEATRQVVFALTAGMFLYVACVEMLPALIHVEVENFWAGFICKNVGLLLGFLLMFLIASFEEYIAF